MIIKNTSGNWAWWYMSAIPGDREKENEFQASLGYMVNLLGKVGRNAQKDMGR